MDVLLIQGKNVGVPFFLQEAADLFIVGNEFEGRVLSNLGYNRAILLFRGFPVVAATPGDLEEGSVIRVRVIQSASPPVLKMISQSPPEEHKLRSILKTYLPIEVKSVSEWIGAFRGELDLARNWFYRKFSGDFPLEQALDRLEHLLVDLDKSRPSAQQIRSFLMNSGLSYEAKIMRWVLGGFPEHPPGADFFLEDTKGMLMALERELKKLLRLHPMSSEKMEGLLQRLFEGLQQIERQQVMYAFSEPREGYPWFQIPIQFKDERTTLWIKLRPRRKKAGEDERNSTEIVLFLELRSLGKLRIHTFLRSQSISCKIESNHSEVVAFIKPFLPELEETMVLKGYQVKHLECIEKEVPDIYPDMSARSILASGLKIVDAVI